MSLVHSNNSSIKQRVLRWYKKQQAIREMRSLPDHLLVDIGVQRDQIPALVNGMMARQSTWQDVPAQSASHSFASPQRHSS
ncbi:MAG: DUF1127 domain-containing protein [Gammaproteobacteria bacterium]